MSKLQVITYANGNYVALDGRVTSVTVGGDTAKAYRTCSVDVLNASNMRQSVLTFQNGKELRVIYDNVEVFRGIIMQHGIDTDGQTQLVAHDYNFYLTKNADTVNYKNMTADAILKDLCGKFGIPTGEIVGTGYVLKKFIKSGTIYDLVMHALSETQRQTSKIYRLRNRNGGVELTDISQVVATVVLENGKQILSASYNESIEDIQTAVKLTGGDEENPVTVIVKAPNASEYGSMQHYEHVSDVKKASELQAKANSMADEMSRPKREYKVSCLGDTAVMSGSAVGVIESMTRLSGTFTVEADSHKFEAGGLYTMDLTLSKI